MSLSGLYNLGHDVGGFSGDKPDRNVCTLGTKRRDASALYDSLMER
ncbi:putative glucosidase [Escherichia coli]|uniref:Putative glucosidase n=1 Tax=Escherichia coli TaxID=562 RepID=A0A377AXR3_ECOLX|nr:putative glucosidase [Escherichia coli]